MKKVFLFAAVISVLILNSCGGSGGSDGDQALYPPALPTDLVVSDMDPSTVTIQWTDNADNESGYEIERSVNSGDYAPVAQTGADETEFTENLADNDYYTYRVRAYNGAGDSAYSNEASVKRPESAVADIDAETGGSIQLNSIATITFPADSLADDESFVVVEGVKEESVPDDKTPYLDIVSDVKPLSIVDFSLADAEVNKNFRLVMSYDPAILEQINSRNADGIAELVSRGVITQADADRRIVTASDLDIYYFNTITFKWVKTKAVINTTAHTLTLETPYLGIYCVGYSMAQKTGYSLEDNPDIQQYIIDTLNNPEEIYGDSSETGKSAGTCPYSCGSKSSSVKLKAITIMDGYHSGCKRCPSSMDVDNDGDMDGSIPGDSEHDTQELGCDYCSTPNDLVDALSGFIFKGACANHDCCYRHGYTTYGYSKWPCDKRFLGEMISISEDEYPLFGKVSFELTPWGPRITIKYPIPWNLLLRAQALYLSGVMFHNAEVLSLFDTVAAYNHQPCFDYYKRGVDCGIPILHDLKISGDGKSWCEPGQSIGVESSIYNRDGHFITYEWGTTAGSIIVDSLNPGIITWTAPASIDDDLEVVITCTISDGVNNIPAKNIKVKVFKPYTITYNANAADSGTAPAAQGHIYYGTAVTVANNDGGLVKTGCNFGGWNTLGDGTGLDRPAGSFYIMGKADVELFAKWTVFPVVYNGNGNTGGSAPVDTANYQVGDIVIVSGPGDIVRDTDTFLCWNTSYDGSGLNYYPGYSFQFESNMTFYAKWLWTRNLGVENCTTISMNIAVDSNGSLFITGSTTGNLDGHLLTGTRDAFVVSYNVSGVKQWVHLLGANGANTIGNDIAIDSSGNVYVTGETSGAIDGQSLTGNRDFFVTKYNNLGEKQWTKLLGANGANTIGYSIVVDSSGSCYIAGTTTGNLDGQILTGTQDAFVVCYNAAGEKQWTKLFGVSNGGIYANDIAIDLNGDWYVVGSTQGALNGEINIGTGDAFIVKYNSSRELVWTKLLGSSGRSTRGYSIAVDINGNCYSTGYTTGNLDGNTLTGNYDVFVVKYNNAGEKQWTKLTGAAHVQTIGYGIAVDVNGNCYVTGETWGPIDSNVQTGNSDVFLIKYDSFGVKQWSKLIGATGASTRGYGIKVDANGGCYVAGYTTGNINGQTIIGTVDTFVTTQFNQ